MYGKAGGNSERIKLDEPALFGYYLNAFYDKDDHLSAVKTNARNYPGQKQFLTLNS